MGQPLRRLLLGRECPYLQPAAGNAQVYVAAAGPESAELAGRIGDGLIATAPDRELVRAFEQAGGAGKPKVGQLAVCWGEDEGSAVRTALDLWPNAAIHGPASQELPLPRHFEALVKSVTPDQIAQITACGPNPDRHIGEVQECADAGFDVISVHQIGPDEEGFLRFYEHEVVPHFDHAATAAAAARSRGDAR